MCRPTTCDVCGKTTWTGCGQHIAQVEAAVPAGQAQQPATSSPNGLDQLASQP